MRASVQPRFDRGPELSRLEHLRTGQNLPRNDPKALRKVAEEFEALLMEQMMREMRKTIPESDLFKDSKGEEIFREMLDAEYVQRMTQRGGIGIADLLMQDWARLGVTK